MSEPAHGDPEVSRPHMPSEYGILEPAEGVGLLPWAWAVERLSDSRSQWIATAGPDGAPHVMLVWGVWLDDRFYFGTSPHSRKARNLAANPRCVVCTERIDEPVIVEGIAEEVVDHTLRRQFEEAYRKKYQEDIDTDLFPVHVVRPQVAYGFVSDPKQWTGSVTRWKFGDR